MLVGAPGCGEDPICGPGEEPADGVVATVEGATVLYGNFASSPNNDCTPTGREPTSLTLDGRQVDPAPAIPYGITFCLPRPDVIGSEPITVDDPDTLQVIDVFAELEDGCLVLLDRTRASTGTATFEGYCAEGLDPGGYALSFTATIPVTRMCDGRAEVMELSGRTTVEALSL